MLGTIRKWAFILVAVAIVVFIGIMGFNATLNYWNYTFKRDKEAERMKKQKEREEKEQLDIDIARRQKEALEGFNAKDKGEILNVEEVGHLGMLGNEAINCLKCNSCKDCEKGDECEKMEPKLIFSNRVNNYLRDVLENMIRFVNNQEMESDSYNDNISRYLKRYNAVLYGAPGTGKTELVNELVHHLFEKFSNPKIQALKKEIVKMEKELEEGRKKVAEKGRMSTELTEEEKKMEKIIKKREEELSEKTMQLKKLERTNRIPPVFKIDGIKLQTGGVVANQLSPEEKLIKIIAELKKQAFDGNVFSEEPYIVFIEEADQGKNVLSSDKGKLLEEYKNFLSTSKDKMGLKANAQDPNSIIIIATNNFDEIDPAVFRRGRLGERLNFSWTPALLEKYGNQNDSEWDKVYWPENDPGWQFIGNVNYQDLYLLTSQFGYSVFADKFTSKTKTRIEKPGIINKANQIIDSYKKLTKEEKEIKEEELGRFVTGRKINVDGKEEKEKVCNWLLHFLYTFFDYHGRDDLESFKDASQIISYDFGQAFNTQQKIAGVTRQIGELVTVSNLSKNIAAETAKDIHVIGKLFLENSSAQDQFTEMKDKINEMVRSIDSNSKNFGNELKILQSNIQRISGSSGSTSGDLIGLSNRISALENKITSSSSSSVPVAKVNALGGKINELQKKLNALISNMNNPSNLTSSVNDLKQILSELLDSYNSI